MHFVLHEVLKLADPIKSDASPLSGAMQILGRKMSSHFPQTINLQYATRHRCIYCGKHDEKLTDEHIVPFSLAGNVVLEKASCKECNKITSAFEGTVARSVFGNLRMKYKLPTRRPKERPEKILFDNSEGTNWEVPINEMPTVLFIFWCTTAGILSGVPPQVDHSIFWELKSISNAEEMAIFEDKYGKGTRLKFRNCKNEYSRTLLKIGYCYAVGLLGLDGFTPICTNNILNSKSSPSYLVGNTDSDELVNNEPDKLLSSMGAHLLNLQARAVRGKYLISVKIRLFSSLSTPTYEVFVGVTDTVDQSKKLLDLFNNNKAQ